MNAKVVVITTVVAVISVFISLDSFRGLEGVLEVLPLVGATGPETLAFDANGGGPYTGVSDGRILKWEAEQRRWIDFAASPGHLSNRCRGDPEREHVCGRPLGLRFNEKTGELYIADAYLGLLMVAPNHTIASPVATQAQGFPFRFTNSLDIDQDSGVVYFTDSSARFQRREFMSAIISGDKTGRLMKYDPNTKEVQVLLDGLSFPNGVALTRDGSSLLVAETTTCRILRYSLRPPTPAASFEVLAQLPGFPDNIKRSPRGGFWVALHSRRGRVLRWVLSVRRIGEVLLRIPVDIQMLASAFSRWRGRALAVRLSEEGEVIEVLEGFGGRVMRCISEVEEHTQGSLLVGSVMLPFVGLHKLQYQSKNTEKNMNLNC